MLSTKWTEETNKEISNIPTVNPPIIVGLYSTNSLMPNRAPIIYPIISKSKLEKIVV